MTEQEIRTELKRLDAALQRHERFQMEHDALRAYHGAKARLISLNAHKLEAKLSALPEPAMC